MYKFVLKYIYYHLAAFIMYTVGGGGGGSIYIKFKKKIRQTIIYLGTPGKIEHKRLSGAPLLSLPERNRTNNKTFNIYNL